MNHSLTKVALRYCALYLDINRNDISMTSEATAQTMAFVGRLKENGFCVSEELLHALNAVAPSTLTDITECINKVMEVDLNWAPLVKGWDVPTGESYTDHLITWMANIFDFEKAGINGTTLPCGHFIPNDTFPIERYNGCPFCGTQFNTTDFVYNAQGNKLKELRLFTDIDMRNIFASLLSSATPLDATQRHSLEILLQHYKMPANAEIAMKETAMLAIKLLVAHDKADEAANLLKTPTDILRYLWYEKTGYVQIIEPKTLIAHASKLYSHMWGPLHRGADAAAEMKQKLKLKYDRKTCQRVAIWMNTLQMNAYQAAENMNPKRGMWARMIRALRLGEYSRKNGMEHLAEILDVFYKQEYTTWQGQVDKARNNNDAGHTLALLKERPGLFARCLFATILRFGNDRVLTAFNEIAHNIPARLLLSLGNAAESYFSTKSTRIVHPITGTTLRIEPNKLLTHYSEKTLQKIVADINAVYINQMEYRFAAEPSKAKTIFIHPMLYNVPVSIGNRTTSIQDTSCALMGTRFPVEGDAIRLFMQWGKGLKAQHLDMDLSCRIALPKEKIAECAYFNLQCVGAKHSGDVRNIPDLVGTAEYIELSLPKLEATGAKYVTFTCNAYSVGALSPNLVVGWMDSVNPMKISPKTGVAYDPSCVQHMIRISENNLAKGLVFGVLDIAKREIIWLEMPFTAQTIRSADSASIEALICTLEAKLTVGQLLDIKAKAQKLNPVETADEADEAYTYQWALNPADVAKLLYI